MALGESCSDHWPSGLVMNHEHCFDPILIQSFRSLPCNPNSKNIFRKDWLAICGILWARCTLLFLLSPLPALAFARRGCSDNFTNSSLGHGIPFSFAGGLRKASFAPFLLPCCITAGLNTFSSSHIWLTSFVSLGTMIDDYCWAAGIGRWFFHHLHECFGVLPDHLAVYVSTFWLIGIDHVSTPADHTYRIIPTYPHPLILNGVNVYLLYPITSHQNCTLFILDYIYWTYQIIPNQTKKTEQIRANSISIRHVAHQ